jgi:ABC-type dipeptide/oligopeptide/nickel transport system permease component
MDFRRGFAAISFWLALPFGIACGIFMAIKAGNPFVFILGFMVGLVFIMAVYVLIALILVPAVKIFWENLKGKRERNS